MNPLSISEKYRVVIEPDKWFFQERDGNQWLHMIDISPSLEGAYTIINLVMRLSGAKDLNHLLDITDKLALALNKSGGRQ